MTAQKHRIQRLQTMKERLTETATTAFGLARHRDVSFLAGSIAFFAFLSLIPTMVLVLALGSLVGGEQFAARILTLVGSYLSEEGSQILREALEDTGGLASISAVSSVFLLWSALKVFRALDVAFNRVYQAQSDSSIFDQLRHGVVVSVAVGLGVGMLLAVQIALTQLGVMTMSGLLGAPTFIIGLFLVLWPLYYFLPPISRPFRTVLPGIAASVVGLLLLQQLFELYATQAIQYQAYGVIGAVLLFLLWLYFGALILVVGAIINASLTETSNRSARKKDLQREDATTEMND